MFKDEFYGKHPQIGTKVKYMGKDYTIKDISDDGLTLVNEDQTEFVGVHISNPALELSETENAE